MPSHQECGGVDVAAWLLLLFLTWTTFISTCTAHVKMSYPVPLGDQTLGGTNPDYDMSSPLDPSGSNFPCRGHTDAEWLNQASWTAGQTYNMSVSGGASHRGGSCQLSLSYDKQTFRVIKSIVGGCPLASIYDFTIPSDAPGGRALFAWTWQNEMGNREFYMNCAQVEILNAAPAKYVRRADALSTLPQIWVANLYGINSCTTSEGTDPVYPAPGCSVEYGGNYDGNDPPNATSNPGDCDFGSSQPICPKSGPAIAAVQNPGMVMAETPESSSSQSLLQLSTITDYGVTPSPAPSLLPLTTITDYGPASTRSALAFEPPSFIGPVEGGPLTEEQSPDGGPMVIAPQFGGPLAIQGPEGPQDGCPADETVTSTAPARTVWASRVNGTASPPCYPNMTVTATVPVSTRTLRPTRTRSPSTSRPYPPPIRSRTPLPPQSSRPPPPPTGPGAGYAGNNVMAYMPCEPGYFLCGDADTFYTCDQSTDPGQRWVWQYPRKVAAGMMCQPQLVACAPGSEGCSTGTGVVPAGYLREDQYVRAA